MAILTIEEIPDEVFVALESRAALNRRTLEDEAISCLRVGLSQEPRGIVISNDSLWDSKHAV